MIKYYVLNPEYMPIPFLYTMLMFKILNMLETYVLT